jgi:hypothetical protein
MKCHTNVNHTPPTQLPHKFSYTVAILSHNHFESPNICTYRYFEHILLQILSCIYKKIKKGKIPYSFLPSLVIQYKIKNKIYN